jgi:hypothetical protein
MNDKEKDYQLLLDKVSEVFGDDLDRLTETQEVVVNRLIDISIEESGGPGMVTIAQVQGAKEMLNNEFGMANAEAEEWVRAKGK